MKDLFTFGYSSSGEVVSLRWGRHFRFTPHAKAILGRDDKENIILFSLAQKGDYIFTLAHIPGPLLVLKGEGTDEVLRLAASLVKFYSKEKKAHEAEVLYYKKGCEEKKKVFAQLLSQEEVNTLLITKR